jgi:quinol monooxygenase YgiN
MKHMAKKISVVAIIIAEMGSEEKIYQELKKLVPLTKTESGCIDYVLNRSNDDSGLFIMYENWKSKEDLDRHNQSKHFNAFQSNTQGIIKELKVHELTMIENY